MPPPDPILLAPAETPADLDCVRELFTEYQHWLGIDLCFQGFEAELRALPGDYAPPGGCLLLARAGDEAVGVVGMRPLDGQACEMKRLWVRPPRRGRGLGRRLAEAVVEAGRRAGYAAMRLDTLARLEEELGGTLDDLRAEARRHLDHEAKLAALRCPVLVLHTRHDHLIALDHAERLARWSGGRLVVFETGDHNTILMLHGGEVVRAVRGLWEGVAAASP